jgi:hypothetical protein
MKKFGAYKFYLLIETASLLYYFLVFTGMSLYEIRMTGLSPLQLTPTLALIQDADLKPWLASW